MISTKIAARTMPGGSNSPDNHRAAVRSSLPARAARCAAVLMGHKALATTAKRPALTILSVPCRKRPWISVAVAIGFPTNARTTHPRNNTQLEHPHVRRSANRSFAAATA